MALHGLGFSACILASCAPVRSRTSQKAIDPVFVLNVSEAIRGGYSKEGG